MCTILKSAYEAWAAGAEFRSRRGRNLRFAYGDQWADTVNTRRGSMTEEENLRRMGRSPITNNLIRQLLKTVVGRYRTIAAENGIYRSEVSRANSLAELDSRMLEEFLISGAAVQRVVSERRFEGEGVWVDNVDPRRFFVNAFTDPRGSDIELVGMLHDISPAELVGRYGRGDRGRSRRLLDLYAGETPGSRAFAAPESILIPGGGSECVDFFTPIRPGRCRVIEVWTLDAGEEGGSGAAQASHDSTQDDATDTDKAPLNLDFRWHCRVFAPGGELIDSFPSPYAHGSHPFVVKLYPLTDGQVHSFVEDLIDQQKYINRLIVQIDQIMACSAKGALLFPLDQKVKGITLEDVADRWASPDGIIPITGRGTHLPQQVLSNGGADSAYQLLSLQMKMFDNISGVSDVLLGRNVSGAVGTENLRARIESATVALADLFETFGSFRELRDRKIEKIRL